MSRLLCSVCIFSYRHQHSSRSENARGPAARRNKISRMMRIHTTNAFYGDLITRNVAAWQRGRKSFCFRGFLRERLKA
jgi:hypothetical protein